MKNVLFKNSIKQIKNTHRRFVSILVMALLGVGFFAGLYATGPDMKESLDKYLDETDMYDISIVSTLGLTDEDIDQIKNVDGLETAYGIKEKDAEVTIADKEFVMKAAKAGVITVPGIAFGSNGDNHVRMSYANSYENIEKAMDILEESVVNG